MLDKATPLRHNLVSANETLISVWPREKINEIETRHGFFQLYIRCEL